MITLPFNNNPSATDYGNPSRSYTCPADKFALITVTLSVSAYGYRYADFQNGRVEDVVATANANSNSFSFWVKAADVVTVTETVATGAALSNVISTVIQTEDSSFCTCTLNTNIVSRVAAKASILYVTGVTANALFSEVRIDGTADADFVVNEYSLT